MAFIDKTASKHKAASLEDEASLIEHALLYDTAIVRHKAVVGGNARVEMRAVVEGMSYVSGNAVISGDGLIRNPGDYLVLGPSLVTQRYITLHRDTVIGWRVNAGCFSRTIEDFHTRVLITHKKNDLQRNQYLDFFTLFKNHSERQDSVSEIPVDVWKYRNT